MTTGSPGLFAKTILESKFLSWPSVVGTTCTRTPFSDLSTMCPLVADSSDLGLTTGQMSQCLDHRFDCNQIKTFSFFLFIIQKCVRLISPKLGMLMHCVQKYFDFLIGHFGKLCISNEMLPTRKMNIN
jgi:hypothetical protein